MTGSPEFWIKFWGVRGSIPAPGPDTVRYGGNTTSLEVRCGDLCLAIDGGTGVRLYGDTLMRKQPVDVTFLMTHLHLDHVQGFPFFAPFLMPGNRFSIYSALHSGSSVQDVMKMLFAQPAFPVTMDMLKADIDFRRVVPGEPLQIGNVHIKTALLHHPGGVVGYRFEFGGKVYVHCSDWEHPADGSLDHTLVELARDADILSIDATYTDDEYYGRGGPPKHGWGHGTHEEAIRHGRAAGARQILLFHHEPSRGDDAVDRISATLLGDKPDVRFIHEGETITLIPAAVALPLAGTAA